MQKLKASHITYRKLDNTILSNVGFSLNQGEALVISGENGSGKSTLLRIIAGFLQPEQGQIQGVVNQDNLQGDDLISQISYLGHKNGLKEDLTVEENLKFCQCLHPSQQKISIKGKIQKFGLVNSINKRVKHLSFGQKRKAALLRVIQSGKCLWLLDEPFIGLDQMSVEILCLSIQEHLARQGMLLFTHHGQLPFEAKIKQLNLN